MRLFNNAATDVTPPTGNGAIPTDIPGDFFIADTTVTIPAGANFLFFSALDDYFGDNVDPNGDFRVRISGPSRFIALAPPPTEVPDNGRRDERAAGLHGE